MQIWHRGSNFKTLMLGDFGIMFPWELAILTFRSLGNSVTSPDCDCLLPYQIVIVSLNGFKRRIATFHNTQNMPRIDELSVSLDSWHWIPVRGRPSPMISSLVKVFVRGSSGLGFFSVRHNTNPTQRVDFQIPFVRRLWAPWLSGNWSYGPYEAYRTQFRRSVVILCHQNKLSLSPWMASGGKLQLSITCKSCLRLTNRHLHWTLGTGFQLRGPLSCNSISQKIVC